MIGERMKIAIIGTGYVGLCTGTGFASKGHDVVCVDIDEVKVNKVNSGIPPIYETDLEDMLKDVISKNRLRATTNINSAIKECEVVFICVGTPSDDVGRIDLKYVRQSALDIGNALRECDYKVVVVKSTVTPETTENIVIPKIEEASGKKVGQDFGMCMTPEFLREGSALKDVLEPDRTVIGEYDQRSGDTIEPIFKELNAPILRTKIKVAELIKYANNAFLATKISYSNEIGNICKRLGVDVYDVLKGVGMDHRMSPYFFNAGAGWGGSCFPKDVAAIIEKAKELGYEPKMLQEVVDINKRQKVRMVEQLQKKMDIKNKKIAVLGLSFKANTDDIRDASSIDIIKKLLDSGAIVAAYDPQAMENMKHIFPGITYNENATETLRDADACLIVTEWEEFKNLKDENFNIMKNKLILEGRKVLDKKEIKDFDGICW